MLNQIGDEAADDLLAFYRSHLVKDVTGSGKYEAHFSIALLLWRNYGNDRLDEIIDQFRQAAETAVQIIEARPQRSDRTTEDLFNFMFPLLVIYIFGGRSARARLAALAKDQWAPRKEDGFGSLIMLFELLCKGAVMREFSAEALHRILEKNASYSTHPFYQPWIEAMCHGLMAVANNDLAAIEKNIEILIDLHGDEAYDGSWCRLVEGLIAFWPLSVKVTAEYRGIKPRAASEYLPDIPVEKLL